MSCQLRNNYENLDNFSIILRLLLAARRRRSCHSLIISGGDEVSCSEVQHDQHQQLYISLLVSSQTVVVACNESTPGSIYFLIWATASLLYLLRWCRTFWGRKMLSFNFPIRWDEMNHNHVRHDWMSRQGKGWSASLDIQSRLQCHTMTKWQNDKMIKMTES